MAKTRQFVETATSPVTAIDRSPVDRSPSARASGLSIRVENNSNDCASQDAAPVDRTGACRFLPCRAAFVSAARWRFSPRPPAPLEGYMVGGRQYVALAGDGGIFSFALVQ